MHYRNGREAKNGDLIVSIGHEGRIDAVGVLHSATPGNDYCNGFIAPTQQSPAAACLVDCLHIDDLKKLIADAGLDKRPPGK